MKKNLLLIFITAIICITGTSYAAYKLTAKEVSFDQTTTNLNSENVQDSIDEIADLIKYGDATEQNILAGKTALVKGKKITGTIENRGQLNWKPNTSTTYTVPAGYYTGGTLDSSLAYSATPSYTVESRQINFSEVNGTYNGSATFSNTILGIESVTMSEGYQRWISDISISISGSTVTITVKSTIKPNPRFTINARVLK